MDYEKIGRFIAEKRKEKGLTQKELASQLGLGDKASCCRYFERFFSLYRNPGVLLRPDSGTV